MTLACIFGAEMHLSLMWRGGECLKYTVSSSEKSLIFRILIQHSILGEKKKVKKHWFGFEPGYLFELVKRYF